MIHNNGWRRERPIPSFLTTSPSQKNTQYHGDGKSHAHAQHKTTGIFRRAERPPPDTPGDVAWERKCPGAIPYRRNLPTGSRNIPPESETGSGKLYVRSNCLETVRLPWEGGPVPGNSPTGCST